MNKKNIINKKSVYCFISFSLILLSIFCLNGFVKADDPITTVSVNPLNQNVKPGGTFFVNVSCVPVVPIKAFELKVSFDPLYLTVDSVTEGNIFNGYNTFFNKGNINNTAGKIENIYNLILGQGNVTESGTFIRVKFTAKQNMGTSLIDLYDVGVTNEQAYININVNDGYVTIGNSLPTAKDDNYKTSVNQKLIISAPGVLTNDINPNDDELTAVLYSSVLHGTLVFNTDGSFTYTPDNNYCGKDEFKYKANDSVSHSNIATVTISVEPALILIKPENALYIRNNKIISFGKPLIIGKIDLEIKTTEQLNIKEVKFYINEKYIGNDTTAPYTYTWDEKTLLKLTHAIKIIAYNDSGVVGELEKTVIKLF